MLPEPAAGTPRYGPAQRPADGQQRCQSALRGWRDRLHPGLVGYERQLHTGVDEGHSQSKSYEKSRTRPAFRTGQPSIGYQQQRASRHQHGGIAEPVEEAGAPSADHDATRHHGRDASRGAPEARQSALARRELGREEHPGGIVGSEHHRLLRHAPAQCGGRADQPDGVHRSVLHERSYRTIGRRSTGQEPADERDGH